jgi:hypothetical protein
MSDLLAKELDRDTAYQQWGFETKKTKSSTKTELKNTLSDEWEVYSRFLCESGTHAATDRYSGAYSKLLSILQQSLELRKKGLNYVNQFQTLLKEADHLLEFEDDWDGNGSPGYSLETLQGAKDFLISIYSRIWSKHQAKPDLPKISPGPDGTIDLHWKTGHRELLINIPVGGKGFAEFYGDNFEEEQLKGNLDLSVPNEWILLWLNR